MGNREYGIDPKRLQEYALEIKKIYEKGVEIAIVIGGGNIFRGISGASKGMDRVQADHMGMLATVMNALALQGALERIDCYARVMSAIRINEVCEDYIRRRAVRHMEKGRVVIFAAGTGNPFFTTDSGAALRAAEMKCDAFLKGTQVDGVYSEDPKVNPEAERYQTLGYEEVITRNLKVMDTTAIALARDNSIPVIVFSIHTPGALVSVLQETGTYTVVGD